MKKLIFSLALCASVFVACSDDDDDEKSNVNTTGSLKSDASILSTDDGDLVLTSNGLWNFDYDKNGQCTKIYRYDKYFKRDYYYDLTDPKNVVAEYEEDGIVCSSEMKFSFNESGYISKVSATYSSYDEQGSYTLTITYNSQGQISYMEGEENRDYDQDFKLTTSFSYDNGNMVTLTASNTDKEYEDWGYGGTVAYTYGNDENKYQQMSFCFTGSIERCSVELTALEPFFDIGWLGKGSKKLATNERLFGQYEYWLDDDSEEWDCDNCRGTSWSEDLKYELNDNGTIHSISDYYDCYEYTYASIN